MRLLAIGDIHGCTTALDTLFEVVQPTADDWLITLGDYIDRGPDSRGTLDRLVRLAMRGQLIALRGNHEQMMLDAREDLGLFSAWLQFGGQHTLDSYGTHERPGALQDVPDEHWGFLEQVCVNSFEIEKHLFVHANADPRLPLADQPIAMLRWQKFYDPPPHRSGKTLICGHTPQESGWPRNIGHAVCIDTWVYGDGWLTCLDVDSGHFWQANQRGQSRQSELAEHLVTPNKS